METTLIPYLHFQGSCEEALKTYEKIFDGKIMELKRFGEGPMNVPDSHKNQILHLLLKFGDNTIMASDTFPGSPLQTGHNIVMSLAFKDEEATRNAFQQLSEGGKVLMPLEKQFWGALFGQLEDKFGIRWMLNCEN